MKNLPDKKLWIFQLILIFGYFGVSETDVLLPLRVNVNFPPASSSRSANNGRSSVDVNTSSNKLRIKRAGDDDETPHDAEMRLWDTIFANALATSNTSQWVHLRQIFDRVEEELHKTKLTGNTSLDQMHSGFLIPPHQTTLAGTHPKAVGPKHPKFSYHRVSGPLRGRGRPFAAVTLAIANSADDISERKLERNTLNSDHTLSDQEQDHFSPDAHDPHQGGEEERETLLNNDFNNFKNFDHSEFPSHLPNKLASLENFESFPNSDGSKNVQLRVSGHNHHGNRDKVSISAPREGKTHMHTPEYHPQHHETRGRHQHHKDNADHFHLKHWNSDWDVTSTDKFYHHRSERRRKNGRHDHHHHHHRSHHQNQPVE